MCVCVLCEGAGGLLVWLPNWCQKLVTALGQEVKDRGLPVLGGVLGGLKFHLTLNAYVLPCWGSDPDLFPLFFFCGLSSKPMWIPHNRARKQAPSQQNSLTHSCLDVCQEQKNSAAESDLVSLRWPCELCTKTDKQGPHPQPYATKTYCLCH